MGRRRVTIPLFIKHSVKGRFIRGYQWRGSRHIVIGSARSCHIRLLSRDISGVTCTLEFGKDGWVVNDLGSQPDLKINGKPFVEHKLSGKSTLVIGEHTLVFEPVTMRREMFTRRRQMSGPIQKLTVVKWKGRVVETHFGKSAIRVEDHKNLEIVEVDVPMMPKVEREKLAIEPEIRKPLMGTLATVAVFFALLFGLPSPQHETQKPRDNVFTKMIFDSKILAQKKKQLTTYAHRTTGTGTGNGSVSEGAKGQQSSATRAVTSLRKAGLQSLITKIAGRAAQSARMIASIAAMPSANANTGASDMGDINAMPSTGAASGKSLLGGNNKGFKINGIGTSGKGGGSGTYKDGSSLGTGNTGNGEVALEDAESVIEGGLDREVIAAVIKEHLGQVRYCYERQLAANSDLYGKIKVKFNIDAEGVVESQSIGQSTLKSAMVEECILRRIATWKFPKPKGGTKVMVSYPFLFKSVN